MTAPAQLFVVGVGRSGTSLLQSMFAAHPAVAYMPETAFLRRYVPIGALADTYKSSGECAVVRVLSEDKTFVRSGLDAAVLVKHAVESDELLDAAIYSQMVRAHRRDGVVTVGDKDPRLIEFLPLAASLFPGATIINIIRDPRDVLLSKKNAAWSSSGHVWKHVFANRVQLKLGRRSGQDLSGVSYHEIIYEDLIASPGRVLSKLCKNIGLPFDDDMLSFGEAAKKLVSESELSWKKETIGPLLSENKEKWKAGLRRREIVLTELCCTEAMRAGGYRADSRTQSLSALDKLWVLSGAAVILITDWPYRLYRNYKVWRACKRIR